MTLSELTQTSTLEQVAEAIQGLAKQLSKSSPLMRAKVEMEAQERLVELGLKKYKKLVKVGLELRKGKSQGRALTENVNFPNSLNYNTYSTETVRYKVEEKNIEGEKEINGEGGTPPIPRLISK